MINYTGWADRNSPKLHLRFMERVGMNTIAFLRKFSSPYLSFKHFAFLATLRQPISNVNR